MKFFKVVFTLIVIALIVLAVYYIYKGESSTNNNTQGDVIIKTKLNSIKIGIAGYDTLNPILSTNKNIQDISRLIYDSLFVLDNKYKLQPSLVAEFSRLENNIFIIKLKENIRWQNGEKLTALDVQFTINKLKEHSSIYTANVEHIIGIEVIDNYILKLYLDTDIPFYEYNLTFPILSNKYYENEDFINTYKNHIPIGTGMYKVISNQNDTILLNQNITYWNLPEEIFLDTISVCMYDTMGEVYNEFKIGNIDLFYTTNLNIEEYIGSIGYKTIQYVGREYDFLTFNCENQVLKNTEIRQAISYAIDKSNIISHIYNNKYKSSNFPLDYGNWLYNVDSTSSGFNAEKVSELLLENGWELNRNIWRKKINDRYVNAQLNLVVLNNSEKRLQTVEIIKSQLENVGFKINIIKVTEQKYNEYLQNKSYDILLSGTYMGFSPDLSLYFGNGNLANYYNEEAMNILNEVKNISNEELLKSKYLRLAEIYQNEKPYVSLYYNTNSVITSNNLMGEMTPTFYNLFYNVYKWYREY